MNELDFEWAASTAALMTTLSLIITFIALFALLVMSLLDGWHEDRLFDHDRRRALRRKTLQRRPVGQRHPLRIVPQPG